MINKMRRAFAVLGVAALLLAGMAAPAQAAVILDGCDERSGDGWGSLCLFDGTDFSKGDWRLHGVRGIVARPGGCLTLTGFRNTASSFAYNPTYVGQVQLTGDRLKFWNGDYCTGASTTWDADTERSDDDLRTTKRYGSISNWVNSVSIY